MTIFSFALHDTNRAHSLSEISVLMQCTQIQHPWTIPVIVTGTVTHSLSQTSPAIISA